MPKPGPTMTTVHSWNDVPKFRSETDESDWWATHDPGEELLAEMQPVPLNKEERDDRRARTRPVAVRFDESTLQRVRTLAERRNKGYQTLLKEFIVEPLRGGEAGRPRWIVHVIARPSEGAPSGSRRCNAEPLTEPVCRPSLHGSARKPACCSNPTMAVG